jgi:hypothetical protein
VAQRARCVDPPPRGPPQALVPQVAALRTAIRSRAAGSALSHIRRIWRWRWWRESGLSPPRARSPAPGERPTAVASVDSPLSGGTCACPRHRRRVLTIAPVPIVTVRYRCETPAHDPAAVARRERAVRKQEAATSERRERVSCI